MGPGDRLDATAMTAWSPVLDVWDKTLRAHKPAIRGKGKEIMAWKWESVASKDGNSKVVNGCQNPKAIGGCQNPKVVNGDCRNSKAVNGGCPNPKL
ncbi:hypothetical protein CDL15_Pgr026321 [Punica granatum]|uniref:Uncharacterized protein n=1 Tax=Punica granatum TaxID=22663 RepID=A0A218XWJ6_PUNGR|nr:hypothetical protein CDL15_Pgr026321 [Punica granatum]